MYNHTATQTYRFVERVETGYVASDSPRHLVKVDSPKTNEFKGVMTICWQSGEYVSMFWLDRNERFEIGQRITRQRVTYYPDTDTFEFHGMDKLTKIQQAKYEKLAKAILTEYEAEYRHLRNVNNDAEIAQRKQRHDDMIATMQAFIDELSQPITSVSDSYEMTSRIAQKLKRI